MPGGDRNGPMGLGPMTGRGAGYCADFAGPGFVNRVFGGRRGWRHMFYATGLPRWARMGMGVAGATLAAGAFRSMAPEQELDALKQQADQVASMLENIRQRISELESGTPQ
jgi:Family of unknown function (DUF5320)